VKDFGILDACLHNWLKRADVEDGLTPGVTVKDAVELREAKKMTYPLVLDLAAPDAPVRVPVVVACRMLGFSKQSVTHARFDRRRWRISGRSSRPN
jgi:hypothetical protein